MFGFKWRRRSEKKPDWNELRTKLKTVEKELQTLAQRNVVYHIHVQNLHVHNPKLDQLAFRLDQLDIKELSGSLNLGNNFGVNERTKVEELLNRKKSEDDELGRSISGSGPDASGLGKQAKGYTFKFAPKPENR